MNGSALTTAAAGLPAPQRAQPSGAPGSPVPQRAQRSGAPGSSASQQPQRSATAGPPAPQQAHRPEPARPAHPTPTWAAAPLRPPRIPALGPERSLLVVDGRDTGRAWAPLGIRTARVGRDVTTDAPSWSAYLTALHRAGHPPHALVFDLPAATTSPERAAELTLPALHALGRATHSTPVRLAFLVTGRARPELAAALGALAQQAGAEDGRVHALCLAVQALPSGAEDPFRLALAELALPRPELAEVRYTATGRQVRAPYTTPDQTPAPAPAPGRGAPRAALRGGGRYLLTDTGSGTGTRLALSLARRHRARIVLLGPAGGPVPADAGIVTVTGRPSRADDVHAAVRTALDRFKGLDGVVHCPGHGEHRPLAALSAATAAHVLADAVTGAGHLDRATAELPLDFFALTLPAGAPLPVAGAALPATVGRALDALAAERARLAGAGLRHGACVTVTLHRPAGTGLPDALTRALAGGSGELSPCAPAAH
ncbi:KR domain-containing protein [Streptomyces sp. NPDC058308]|uniref:KR domain-containing protein n=1 Tax=Streptomyces sp. NPDC058308 TaxID=3346440 RepID=UPI0036E6794A